MICNNCNFNNDDNAVFCSKCGKKLNNQKSYGIGKKPYKNQKDEYNPSEYNYNCGGGLYEKEKHYQFDSVSC